jgi:arylsulfatase A-like enzyme
VCGFSAAQPPDASSKPNVLVIVADDLGSADVGFNGGKISTPNLDRLAGSGIKLTDFRACPMCSPTRAGLLTGRWPIRYGLMRSVVPPWSTNGLPASEKTLAELLGAAGYEQRGIIGKWHLGHARKEFLPLAQGFTRFYGHYNGAIDYFTHEREGELDWHEGDASLKREGYSTDLLGDEAAAFITKAPNGKPWFLYVPFNAPHAPFQAKQSDLARYPQFKMPDRRAYAAMVDSMDQAVGKLLEAVEKRPDSTNTLVLFFSDNGGVPKVGSNAPWRGWKLTVYEGGTRVCAAIRWPAGGLTGGKEFGGRIGYIDVLPTLLAAAGAAIPANLDGVNFLPALRGEKPLNSRLWFSYIHQGKDAHASVHDGKWKLVAHGDFFAPSGVPELELYDLEKDPGETNDVAKANPETIKVLRKALVDFGKLRTTEGEDYAAGRANFHAPKDWKITE